MTNIDATPPSPAEIEGAENFLLNILITRTDHRLRLPRAISMARQAGIKWRAIVAARRQAGIVATRDSDGEWLWMLQPGVAVPAGRAA